MSGQIHQNGLFTATRSYDGAGRLTGVTNGALDSTGYTLSPDGRRTGISRNGESETYGYDNARQVTSASYGGLSTNQSWNYDAAGNRSSATTNGLTTTYLANTVNEYTSISGGGFQPPSPSYDSNGNTLNLPRPDGTALTLTWNINNELIAATAANGDSVSYQYDALGRRVRTTSTISNNQSTIFNFNNAWNVELEHNGSAYTRRMTWGLDLSQSPQGAGGVGGLVMTEDLPPGPLAPIPHFPTYDGNGNVTAWVNGSGTVVARQRYDAYGNIIHQTGTAPSDYGFSTKPMDQVIGLLYYGYRFYDPVTGRWPSRDPIEEQGGINLYGFVRNNGVNAWDYLGFANTRIQFYFIGEKLMEEWWSKTTRFELLPSFDDAYCVYALFSQKKHHEIYGNLFLKYRTDMMDNVFRNILDNVVGDIIEDNIPGGGIIDLITQAIKESLDDGVGPPPEDQSFTIDGFVDDLTEKREVITPEPWHYTNSIKIPSYGCPCEPIANRVRDKIDFKDYKVK